MSEQLSPTVKTLRNRPDGSGYTVSAGTTDLTSDAIDTAGFNGVRVITAFGAITTGAVTSVKLQECDTSGGTYADLAGTSISVADDDDNQVVIHDLCKPLKRYVKVVIDRGTQNAVVDGQIVELYGARNAPTTDDATTVVARELHVSPVAGTA